MSDMNLRAEALDAMWDGIGRAAVTGGGRVDLVVAALDGLLDWLSTTTPEELGVWELVDLLREEEG